MTITDLKKYAERMNEQHSPLDRHYYEAAKTRLIEHRKQLKLNFNGN